MTDRDVMLDQMVSEAVPILLHGTCPPAAPEKAPRPRKAWPAAILFALSLAACAPPPPEIDMNMPGFPGPFLDPSFCDSTGGGWLLDRMEGYTLWQMEQVGVDDMGDVQIRYEIRDGDLACPVSFVDAVAPVYFKDGLSGSLASAWLLQSDGGGFRGAAQRELEIFLQECYAERGNDAVCWEQPDGTSGMGVWKAFYNKVNGVSTSQSIVIINGKVFDTRTENWDQIS
jgi:hypothetical protein